MGNGRLQLESVRIVDDTTPSRFLFVGIALEVGIQNSVEVL